MDKNTQTHTLKTLKELNQEIFPFKLPKLPYAYDFLKKAIGEETMKFHHDKHHQSYVEKLNKAVKSQEELGVLLRDASKHGDKIRNNGGGHWNHSFFWSLLTGESSDQQPSKEMLNLIEENFKSFESFKEKFIEAGKTHFGSGWVWLIVTPSEGLKITTTPNQDNPLMDLAEDRGTPILTIDLWEHAYYLDYQNERERFLKEVFRIINWNQVFAYYQEAKENL